MRMMVMAVVVMNKHYLGKGSVGSDASQTLSLRDPPQISDHAHLKFESAP